jgi:hypothetical protein
MLRPACGGSKLGALSDQNIDSVEVSGQEAQNSKRKKGIIGHCKRRFCIP